MASPPTPASKIGDRQGVAPPPSSVSESVKSDSAIIEAANRAAAKIVPAFGVLSAATRLFLLICVKICIMAKFSSDYHRIWSDRIRPARSRWRIGFEGSDSTLLPGFWMDLDSPPPSICRSLPDRWSRWFPDPWPKAPPPMDGGTEVFWVMVQKDPWTCFTIAGVAQIKIGDIFAPAVWNLTQLGPWSLTALAVEPKIVACDIFAPGLRYIDKLAYWGCCGTVSDLFIFGHGFGGACVGWFWFQDGFDLVTEERGLCEDAEAGVKRWRGANGDCDSGFPFIMGVPML